jgi:hypothetical protein
MTVGDTIRIPVTFNQNVGGVETPFDPSAYYLIITGLGQSITIPQGSIVRDGVGQYHYDWLSTFAGNAVATYFSAETGLTGSGNQRFEILPLTTT